MKSNIVSDGADRLRDTDEYRLQLEKLRESLRIRYEAELAEAGFVCRTILRWRIAAEFRRQRRKLEPSQHNLYSTRITR